MDDSDFTDPRARAFATALRAFEQDSDAAAFTQLFADGATVQRLDARGERGDVERFWTEYRGQFSDISTTFTHVVEGADATTLEWTSDGHLSDGRSVDYRGVTVIELDGDKITRLRTYYDSAVFTPVPAGVAAGPAAD